MRTPPRVPFQGPLLCVVLLLQFLAGCGGGGDASTTTGAGSPGSPNSPSSPSNPTSPSAATYTVSATVSGLSGSGLTLVLGNGAPVAVNANGTVTLPPSLASGVNYSVSIGAQPTNPVQLCTVSNGAGTVGASNVGNISVACMSNAAASTVTVAPNVPSVTSTAIAQVITAIGSGAPGSPIPISIGAGTDAFVFAVDASQNILLAAMANSAQTTLSAQSTAIALTRMLMGALPAGIGSTQVNTAIQATAEFPNLVALINSAQSSAIVLASSSSIVASLSLVITQIAPSALGQAQGAAPRIKVASVQTPLPYQVLNWQGTSTQAIYVIGGDNLGNVQLANGMSIEWDGSSAGPGGPLCSGGSCGFTLPRAGLLSQAITQNTNPSFGLTPVTLPGNGAVFTVTVAQDSQTHTDNLRQFFTDVVSAATPFGPACTQAIVGTLLSSSQLNALVNQPRDAVQSYLLSLIKNGVVNALKGKLADCVSAGVLVDLSQVGQVIEAEFEFLNIAYGAITTATKAVQGLNTLLEGYLTWFYWDATPTAVTVCEGTLHNTLNQVANCAKSFSLTPNVLYMAPGAQDPGPPITGLDGGSPPAATLVPNDIVYTSTNPGIARVDRSSGAITAVSPGQTLIVATSNSSGAFGGYTLNVATPQITPANVSLVSGFSGVPPVRLQVTDANENVLIVPQGMQWSTSDPQNLTLTPLAPISQLAGSNTTGWALSPNATPNAVTIQADYSAWGSAASATITVRSSTPVTLSASPNPAAIGESVTLTVNTTAHQGSAPPSGTVAITNENKVAICTVTLGNGTGSCSYTYPDSRSHTFTGSYPGDPLYIAGLTNSVTMTAVVYPSTTTMGVMPSSLPSIGGTVSLGATVTSTSAAPGAPPPTGTVAFKDNVRSITVCTAPLGLSGSASCTGTLPVAPDAITATYSGDVNYGPSISSATGVALGPDAFLNGTILYQPTSGDIAGGIGHFTLDLTLGTVTAFDLVNTANNPQYPGTFSYFLSDLITLSYNQQTGMLNLLTDAVLSTNAKYFPQLTYVTNNAGLTATVDFPGIPVSQGPVLATVTGSLALRISPAQPSVNAGATLPLAVSATFNGSSVATPSLQWTSASPAVATVDGNGVVSALQGGTAVIKATDPVTQASDSVVVTVTSAFAGTWSGNISGPTCTGYVYQGQWTVDIVSGGGNTIGITPTFPILSGEPFTVSGNVATSSDNLTTYTLIDPNTAVYSSGGCLSGTLTRQ